MRLERVEVRQDRLDRRRIHGEESSAAFGRSIGVELYRRGPSCQLALNIRILETLHHSSVT